MSESMTREEVYGEARLMARVDWGESKALHLQGIGEEEGRPYGMSVDLYVHGDVVQWVNQQTPSLHSANRLGGPDGDGGWTKNSEPGVVQYVPATLRVDGDNVFLLIEGEEKNHTDGALVQLKAQSASVEFVRAFAEMNGIAEQADGSSNDDSASSGGDE
tara:strand:- start:86 stop:565 length:480 start_codon:yes stop_codon:yes gene_type:complete